MILTSFLVIFFKRGANQLATDFTGTITSDFGEIIVGIIFFFIIGCEFFLNYVVKFRKKDKKNIGELENVKEEK